MSPSKANATRTSAKWHHAALTVCASSVLATELGTAGYPVSSIRLPKFVNQEDGS